ATKKLLPTCKVTDTQNTCSLTTDATAGKSLSDNNAGGPLPANGTITFDMSTVDTLKVGSLYCFLVMSSEKSGAVVSQTSSNINCVRPEYYPTAFNLPTPAAKANNYGVDLNAYAAACNAATSGCPDPNTLSTTVYLAADNTSFTGKSYQAPLHV